MSAVKETFLICDRCRINFGIDNRERSVEQQREAARNNDWIYTGGKDLCQDCRPVTHDGYYCGTIKRKNKL